MERELPLTLISATGDLFRRIFQEIGHSNLCKIVNLIIFNCWLHNDKDTNNKNAF